MFLPLEGHFNAHGEIGPYIGLSPLVLVGLGLQALNNRKLEVRKDFMVFSMFFLGSVFLSGFTGVVSLTEEQKEAGLTVRRQNCYHAQGNSLIVCRSLRPIIKKH